MRGGYPIVGPVEPWTPDLGLSGPASDSGGRGEDSPDKDPSRPSDLLGHTEQVVCPNCRGKVTTHVQGNTLAGAARTCPSCINGQITIFYSGSLLDGQTHIVRLGGSPPNEQCLCPHRIPAGARTKPGTGRICVACWTVLAAIRPTPPQQSSWSTRLS